MDTIVQRSKRNSLKKESGKLLKKYQTLFKGKYSPSKLDMGINDIIDQLPANKLYVAMAFVELLLNKQLISEVNKEHNKERILFYNLTGRFANMET